MLDKPKKVFNVGDTAFVPLVDTIVKTKIVQVITRETKVPKKGTQVEYFYVPDEKDIKMNGIEMVKFTTYDEAEKEQVEVIKMAEEQTYQMMKAQIANVFNKFGLVGGDRVIAMTMELSEEYKKVMEKKAEKKGKK